MVFGCIRAGSRFLFFSGVPSLDMNKLLMDILPYPIDGLHPRGGIARVSKILRGSPTIPSGNLTLHRDLKRPPLP